MISFVLLTTESRFSNCTVIRKYYHCLWVPWGGTVWVEGTVRVNLRYIWMGFIFFFSYRLVPIERFSPASENDTEWALGMVRKGVVNLTTFSMGLSESRYRYHQRIIGPWMESVPMAFFTEKTFMVQPSLQLSTVTAVFSVVALGSRWMMKQLEDFR